jgi:hypothetical protein
VGATGFEGLADNADSAADSVETMRSSSVRSVHVETVGDLSQRAETSPGTLSEAELERAIVEAVMQGLGDVARTLAARLEARRSPAQVIALRNRRR